MTSRSAFHPMLAACAFATAMGLTVAPAAVAADIHRCDDGRGVTYTDRGCAVDARGVVFNVASVNARDLHAAVDRELPVTLGMSPRGVFDALGRPVETIARLQGRQLVEYWLYRGAAGGVTRVAFQEGRVTSIQAR
jgi:hypothetical protein